MLKPKVSESSNAIDAGDVPPARPTSRPSANYDDHLRASRLMAPSDHSDFSFDLDIAPPALMEFKSIEILDAEDRTDEEQPEHHSSIHHKRVIESVGGKPEHNSRSNRKRDFSSGTTRSFSPQSARQYATRILERAHDISTRWSKQMTTKNPRQSKIAPDSPSSRCRWGWIVAFVALLAIAVVSYVLAAANVNVATNNEESTTAPPIAMATTPRIEPKTDESSLTRLESTMAFLARFSGSNLGNLDDDTKPENLAATWIATDDVLSYKVPTSEEDADYMSFLQRYAMAVVYFALNGPGWVDRLSFLSGTHVCGWNSTLTLGNGEVVTLGTTCNSKKEVTAMLIRKYEIEFITVAKLVCIPFSIYDTVYTHTNSFA